jgi:predicted transcriptional regulator
MGKQMTVTDDHYRQVLDMSEDWKLCNEVIKVLHKDKAWTQQLLFRMHKGGFLEVKKTAIEGGTYNLYKRTQKAYLLLDDRIMERSTRDERRAETQRKYALKYARLRSSNQAKRNKIIELITNNPMTAQQIAEAIGINFLLAGRMLAGLESAYLVESVVMPEIDKSTTTYWQKKVKTKGSKIVSFDNKELQEKLHEQNALITKEHHRRFRNSISGSTLEGIG